MGFGGTNVGGVDGDLVPDLLVTAAWDPGGGVRCGRTYVVSGASALRGPKGLDPAMNGAWQAFIDGAAPVDASVEVEGSALRVRIGEQEIVLRR